MAAQFKKNYTSNRSSSIIRILLFGVVFIALSVSLFRSLEVLIEDDPVEESPEINLVRSEGLEVIDHNFFQLGYSENHEQALWAGHLLTKANLLKPNVPRTDYFEVDPLVSTVSAHHRDYTRSGYSRGHMIPAADMAFSSEAMDRSFYMSNISPQLSSFNGGIWRELEELCRDWAMANGALYIVTGPLFLSDEKGKIGQTSGVTVPSHFYKVLLTTDYDAIGFIIPHRLCTEPIMQFAASIDSVEHLTGFDFFNKLNGL